MQTIERQRLTIMVESDIDTSIRQLALDYRKPISDIANEALRYCLHNENFLGGLDQKYRKPEAA